MLKEAIWTTMSCSLRGVWSVGKRTSRGYEGKYSDVLNLQTTIWRCSFSISCCVQEQQDSSVLLCVNTHIPLKTADLLRQIRTFLPEWSFEKQIALNDSFHHRLWLNDSGALIRCIRTQWTQRISQQKIPAEPSPPCFCHNKNLEKAQL